MLHPYQQIPNKPTTFDENYQTDLDNILSAIDRLYTHSPQLSNQRAQLKPQSQDVIALDLVISSIERTNSRRLDSQRASLPALVSQGVTSMGWCVESHSKSRETGPADLELLDRLEKAGARRLTDQCSQIPSIEQKPSLMSLYTESMRETNAMESILTNTGIGRMSNQDAYLRTTRLSTPLDPFTSRPALESETSTLNHDEATSDQIGLLQTSRLASHHSLPDSHRSQPMPNIFKKNKNLPSSPQKRSLFGKKTSNPPDSTTSESRVLVENPFEIPSLMNHPLPSLLDDITNQDLLHFSNDHTSSPDVQQKDLMIEKPNQICWATEVALRIGTTNVWLWRHDGRIIMDESIECRLIEDDLIEFIVKEIESPDVVFKVWLPVKIKCEKERKEGLIVFWNEVEDLNKESEVERVKEEFYGVQDWNRNRPNRIDCRRCGNGLKTDLKKIEKYLGLPSDGWEDFVEYWICHETDDHEGYFDGKKKKGDWKRDVRENEGFVGDKFVEMKEDLLESREMGWEVKEKTKENQPIESDWNLIKCKRCEESLGSINLKTQSIRFTKFSIEPKPWKEKFEWIEILKDEVNRLNRFNGSNRFLIRSDDSHLISFGIWIFNPNVLISNYLMNSVERKSCKVMKVFYQVNEDFQSNQWNEDEEISLPDWGIELILNRIEEWNRFNGLNLIYKTFGEFKIGYL
ncbi:HECT-like ubiquitin-conjugating enzyme-binding-domain-containing protein [Melampsora americana]|nr:HECT-like ubiquitin-conjugating enzyme-binding-domain-containing protein [Melampsora americana]